jgi:hypothetical protein
MTGSQQQVQDGQRPKPHGIRPSVKRIDTICAELRSHIHGRATILCNNGILAGGLLPHASIKMVSVHFFIRGPDV